MLIICCSRTLKGFTALLILAQNITVALGRAFSKHGMVRYCNVVWTRLCLLFHVGAAAKFEWFIHAISVTYIFPSRLFFTRVHETCYVFQCNTISHIWIKKMHPLHVRWVLRYLIIKHTVCTYCKKLRRVEVMHCCWSLVAYFLNYILQMIKRVYF